MKQFTELQAIKAFTMKVPGQRGKPVSVSEGDFFWVTSPSHNNTESVKISRWGKGTLNMGYTMDIETVKTLFEVVGE